MNLKHYKHLLIERKKDIEDTMNLMENNGTGEQNKYSPTELSNYDNHPAEMASELFQVEFNNGIKVHEESILQQINHALDRIENKTYGKCAECGDKISEERLEFIPYADLCINCKVYNEGIKEGVRHRPNEEKVIDAPFGRKYLNKQEDDEYEGLDYLNDLMKYGSADTPQDMGGYKDYKEFYTNEVDKQGVVEKMDNVSNEDYIRQLPD